ncbi:MAG: ribosome-associated translation inhibitor RaiA [Rhodospirillales bacterium]
MQITVTGKQIDVGEALRQHAEERLGEVVAKYFDHGIDANVVLSRVAHLFRADLSVHVGRNILVQSHGEAETAYPAFDVACDRIAKRLRRYKRRLRDHHQAQRRASAEAAAAQATQYVLAPPSDEADDLPEGGAPVIIAENATPMETLTVGEAVMRMDLAEVPALVFRSSVHGGINVVYRRSDGNVGWVDPDGAAAGKPSK